MTAPPIEPAIPVNAPRNVALSGALLASIMVVRSPLGGPGGWDWLLLEGVILLRLAFGDRVLIWAYFRQAKWAWIPMAFVIALELLRGNHAFAHGLAIMILLQASTPGDLVGSVRLHPLHCAASAAGLLLVAETFVRFVLEDLGQGITVARIPYVGGTWRDFLLWIGALVLLTALVIWFDQTRHLSRGLRAARDHALRLKLAPHFIFNTLNTLKAQLERDPREAGATVDRLAALYRQLLERTERATVPLREELAFVEAYLGIEQVRLGGRLRVTIDVPEPLDAQEIPTLGLQTLVENAVKHGIAPREEGGALVIRVRRLAGGMLSVAVENPVAPEAGGAAASGTGTGLETLRARLSSPASLRTETRDGCFLAEFHVPYVEAAA